MPPVVIAPCCMCSHGALSYLALYTCRRVDGNSQQPCSSLAFFCRRTTIGRVPRPNRRFGRFFFVVARIIAQHASDDLAVRPGRGCRPYESLLPLPDFRTCVRLRLLVCGGGHRFDPCWLAGAPGESAMVFSSCDERHITNDSVTSQSRAPSAIAVVLVTFIVVMDNANKNRKNTKHNHSHPPLRKHVQFDTASVCRLVLNLPTF